MTNNICFEQVPLLGQGVQCWMVYTGSFRQIRTYRPSLLVRVGQIPAGFDHARLNYEPSSLDEQRLLRASSYIGAGCSSAGWVYTGSFRQIRTYPPPAEKNLPSCYEKSEILLGTAKIGGFPANSLILSDLPSFQLSFRWLSSC